MGAALRATDSIAAMGAAGVGRSSSAIAWFNTGIALADNVFIAGPPCLFRARRHLMPAGARQCGRGSREGVAVVLAPVLRRWPCVVVRHVLLPAVPRSALCLALLACAALAVAQARPVGGALAGPSESRRQSDPRGAAPLPVAAPLGTAPLGAAPPSAGPPGVALTATDGPPDGRSEAVRSGHNLSLVQREAIRRLSQEQRQGLNRRSVAPSAGAAVLPGHLSPDQRRHLRDQIREDHERRGGRGGGGRRW